MHPATAIQNNWGSSFSQQTKLQLFILLFFTSVKLHNCSYTMLFQKTLPSCVSNAVHYILLPAELRPVLQFQNLWRLNFSFHYPRRPRTLLLFSLSETSRLPRTNGTSIFPDN